MPPDETIALQDLSICQIRNLGKCSGLGDIPGQRSQIYSLGGQVLRVERGLCFWLMPAICLDMGRVEPPVMLPSCAYP